MAAVESMICAFSVNTQTAESGGRETKGVNQKLKSFRNANLIALKDLIKQTPTFSGLCFVCVDRPLKPQHANTKKLTQWKNVFVYYTGNIMDIEVSVSVNTLTNTLLRLVWTLLLLERSLCLHAWKVQSAERC